MALLYPNIKTNLYQMFKTCKTVLIVWLNQYLMELQNDTYDSDTEFSALVSKGIWKCTLYLFICFLPY